MPTLIAKPSPPKKQAAVHAVGRWIALALTGVVLAGLAMWFAAQWNRSSSSPSEAALKTAALDESPSDMLPTRVVLTAAKREAAGIRTTGVEVRQLQPTRRVAGTLDYDAGRYLEIKTPLPGVVKQVMVAPAQQVEEGQRLALVISPEVGKARDEIGSRQAELSQAEKQSEWHTKIAANVDALIEALASSPPMLSIEQQFENKLLGAYRETLFSAYSRHRLAEQVATDMKRLESGVVSGRSMQERQSGREIGQAALKGACEQARFDSRLEADQAKSAVEQADRRLRIARQQLATMLGPYAEADELAGEGEQQLCQFTVRSPMAAAVAERAVVEGMQLTAGQATFSLANTDVLWAKAKLFQTDFSQLPATEALTVTIAAPSLGIEAQSSTVKFIGSRLQDETHALPLVAELDNRSGRYRPGMFVWVSVPLGAVSTGLAVHPAAVLRHEEQDFVFVEEADGSFRRQDVKTGLQTVDWVEITSGLEAGDQVVEQGAFFLKSELLLAGEAE